MPSIEFWMNLGATHENFVMKTVADRNLEKDNIFGPCKDFLCPKSSKLQEWFPDPISAKLRAKALDPYGLMKTKGIHGPNKGDDLYQGSYILTGFKLILSTLHKPFILTSFTTINLELPKLPWLKFVKLRAKALDPYSLVKTKAIHGPNKEGGLFQGSHILTS